MASPSNFFLQDFDELRSSLLSFHLKATLPTKRKLLMPNIKTAIGDLVVWDSLKLPLRGCANTDPTQIWRCRKHKRIEAKCVLSLPLNSSFLDCGSHFGDTTITMAIHARINGRDDLRFIAIEPNRRKCKFIRTMVRANGLENSVRIINACVGDVTRKVKQIEEKGFDMYDGRIAYTEVDEEANEAVVSTKYDSSPFYFNGEEANGEESASESDDSDDEEGGVESTMISLDSIKDEILPLGLLHLDVEGWESKALLGASDILRETTTDCYIICEVWDEKDRKMRKKAIREDTLAGRDVLTLMGKFPQFERTDDIVDQERNLFFRCENKNTH